MNVLCVTDYFLPGFKGGGLVTTLANMRKQLSSEIALSVFTRDRDLGASEPYPHIDTNCWIETPEGAVFYATPDAFGPSGLRMALEKRPAHVLYLNSFFSPWSSIFIQLSRFWIAPEIPVLIAPRGEFSHGALSVKAAKKRIYIWLARKFGFYRDVYWHASTELEARDIIRQFPGANSCIHIAPDPVVAKLAEATPGAFGKQVNQLNIIFISRIAPVKNLARLLEMLSGIHSLVNLDIFGPIEDEEYWLKCKNIVGTLPNNIKVTYRGPIAADEVSNTFARYDLFVFPTKGENFGHVIFESLLAGTPVLLSDRTPWHPDNTGALVVLPLDQLDSWCMAIENAASRTSQEQGILRLAAHDYASRYIAGDVSLNANVEMFKSFLNPR